MSWRQSRESASRLSSSTQDNLWCRSSGTSTALKWSTDLLRKHGGKTKKELETAGKSIKPIAEAAKPKPPTAKASDTSIHVATEAGNIESVKQAIADGADVNEKNADGVAPLSNAAYFGHKEVVELLITNGADVNAKFDGRTPLDFATHPDNPNKNKAELADLLRKHGGKTGEELKAEGWTPKIAK